MSTGEAAFTFLLDYILAPLEAVLDHAVLFLNILVSVIDRLNYYWNIVWSQNSTAGGSDEYQQAGVGLGTTGAAVGGAAVVTWLGGKKRQQAPETIPLGDRLFHWYNQRKRLTKDKAFKHFFSQGEQSNHLNMVSAFKPHADKIGRKKDHFYAVNLKGHSTDPNSEHYKFHKAIDDFYDDFRRGQSRHRQQWTVNDYNRAANKGLENAGLSREQRARALTLMRQEQREMGLTGTSKFKHVPSAATRPPTRPPRR